MFTTAIESETDTHDEHCRHQETSQPLRHVKGLLLNFKHEDIKIIDRLKAGPTSLVLLGLQKKPVHRKVVVKIIKPTSNQQADLFLREVESVSKLNHKNVVRFFSCSHHLKRPHYIVMEHIPGVHLFEHVQQAAPPLGARIELVNQVCEGLTYIHYRGLIHGDLKPENVLVTKVLDKPTVKLIDFGLARKMTMMQTETTAIAPAGTLGYLDPYSIKGDRYFPGVYSDVYALGIIIFELVTEHRIHDFLKSHFGSKPTFESMADVSFHRALTQHIETQLQNSNLHKIQKKNLKMIITKCIHPHPERRFGDLHQLVDALRQTIALVPLPSEEDSLRQRANYFCKRHQKGMTIIAVAVLVLAFFFAAATYKIVDSQRLTKQAEHTKEQAGELLEIFSGILGADEQLPLDAEDTLVDRVFQSAQNIDKRGWSPENQRKILRIYAEIFKNKAVDEGRSAVEYKLYLATIDMANPSETQILEANERFGIYLCTRIGAEKALPHLLAAYSALPTHGPTIDQPAQQQQMTKRAANIARFICKAYRRMGRPEEGLAYLKPYGEFALNLRTNEPEFAKKLLFEWGITLAELDEIEQAEKVFNQIADHEPEGFIVLPERFRERPITPIQE